VQSRSITRTFRAFLCAAALCGGVCTAVPRAQNAAAPVTPATPPPSPAHWREAPGYLALFVPRVNRAAYRAFVSALDLEAAVRAVAPDEDTLHPPGAWLAHAENPVDVFGAAGTYDRFALARLFGSHRPQVARGPRGIHGLVEESWTLMSPYPSIDLSRLEPGTLLLVLRVP
jgi:hypothetical protein